MATSNTGTSRKPVALGKGSSVDGTGILAVMLIPKLNRVEAGADLGSIPAVFKRTIVPPAEHLEITTRHGSTVGAHAADCRSSQSLCNSPLDPVPGSSRDQEKAPRVRGAKGDAAVLATRCQFCQTRLVAAGLLPAALAKPYAADYGSRALADTVARAEADAELEDALRVYDAAHTENDALAAAAAPAKRARRPRK